MKRIVPLLFTVLLLAGCNLAWLPGIIHSPEPGDTPLTGDTAHGEELYKHGKDDAPPCVSCHTLKTGSFSVGPSLIGIMERAGNRIEGLSAEDYIHQSIVMPNEFVVSGYRAIMYPKYGEHLSAQDIADLIAYLSGL